MSHINEKEALRGPRAQQEVLIDPRHAKDSTLKLSENIQSRTQSEVSDTGQLGAKPCQS